VGWAHIRPTTSTCGCNRADSGATFAAILSLTVTRRWFLALAAAVALLAAAPLRAAEPWFIAFETGGHGDPEIPFATNAETTALLISELGPSGLAAIGLDSGLFDAEIVPGGHMAKINPAVLLTLDGGDAQARRTAAAFGHIFGQSAVLIWRDASEGSLVVGVTLPVVTPTLADHFLRLAGAIEPGLAGGFTARGNQLLFINLRGADGRPFSGLEDEQFAAGLQRAAGQFGGIATVSTGRATATLIERADYPALLGTSLATVERLKARRAELGSRR
jgi:hypothetical protein